jgi:hypothetical protein
MVGLVLDGLRPVDMSLWFGSRASDALLLFTGIIEERCIENRGYQLFLHCENRRSAAMLNGNRNHGSIGRFRYELIVNDQNAQYAIVLNGNIAPRYSQSCGCELLVRKQSSQSVAILNGNGNVASIGRHRYVRDVHFQSRSNEIDLIGKTTDASMEDLRREHSAKFLSLDRTIALTGVVALR